MGNSTGKQLAEAEQALLGHGVSWYDQWKRRNGGSDGQITFQVSNVKVRALPFSHHSLFRATCTHAPHTLAH